MVAIKGTKMPLCCEVCDFRKSDPYSGEVYCSKAIGSNTIIYEKERLENCPLVEIVTCKDCELHGHCTAEDTFTFARIDDGFCRVGKHPSDDKGESK